MSPVSPTLVTPLASSSIRLASPSKLTIGKEAAGVSVASTTNSCFLVPLLVTRNDTLPWGAKGWDRSIAMWVASVSDSPTLTGVDPVGVTKKSWCMPIA